MFNGRKTLRESHLKNLIAGGGKAVNAWLAIPSAFSAEVMGHAGFDSATIDLQHGIVDYQAAVTMLQALSSTPTTPLDLSTPNKAATGNNS